MRKTWTSTYLRDELSASWTEVQRDLNAAVLDTIMTCDQKVFVLYCDKKFAVVESVRRAAS